MTKKLKIQLALFAVSIAFNIWGICSIIEVAGFAKFPGLDYLLKIKDWHILVDYVIIVITMAIGIMSASINAGNLDNQKWMKRLTIGITAYSTVLTVPLLLAFICFIPTIAGANLGAFIDEMFGVIAWDFLAIFKNKTLTNVIFVLGILMSIVFLAVPILSAVVTLKKAKEKLKVEEVEND